MNPSSRSRASGSGRSWLTGDRGRSHAYLAVPRGLPPGQLLCATHTALFRPRISPVRLGPPGGESLSQNKSQSKPTR